MVSFWFCNKRYDYACFCLRNGDTAKGEECLKEILSRNAKHVPALVTYGAYCCINEKFAEAKACLSNCLEIKSNHAIAYVVLVFFQYAYSRDYLAKLQMMRANPRNTFRKRRSFTSQKCQVKLESINLKMLHPYICMPQNF
jgi:hypothetical protein